MLELHKFKIHHEDFPDDVIVLAKSLDAARLAIKEQVPGPAETEYLGLVEALVVVLQPAQGTSANYGGS